MALRTHVLCCSLLTAGALRLSRRGALRSGAAGVATAGRSGAAGVATVGGAAMAGGVLLAPRVAAAAGASAFERCPVFVITTADGSTPLFTDPVGAPTSASFFAERRDADAKLKRLRLSAEEAAVFSLPLAEALQPVAVRREKLGFLGARRTKKFRLPRRASKTTRVGGRLARGVEEQPAQSFGVASSTRVEGRLPRRTSKEDTVSANAGCGRSRLLSWVDRSRSQRIRARPRTRPPS